MRVQILSSLALAVALPIGVLVGQPMVPTNLAASFTQRDDDAEQSQEFDEDDEELQQDVNEEDEEEEPGDQREQQLRQAEKLQRDAVQLQSMVALLRAEAQKAAAVAELNRAKQGQSNATGLRLDRSAPTPPYLFSVEPNRNAIGVRFDLEDRKAIELARKYRSLQDEQAKEELRLEITELTTEIFNRRMQQREEQIEAAQARLDKIKKEFEERVQLAEKIIDRRVADLLDDPDPFSWEFQTSVPQSPRNTAAAQWGYTEATASPPAPPKPPKP